MYVDSLLLVSNEQSIATADDTSVLSTYSVDLSSSGADYFKGKQVYAVVIIDVAVTTATSMQFRAVTSTAAGGTTAEKVLADSGAIALASLTLGRTPVVLALPPLISGVEQRYLMLKYTGIGTTGVGTVTAFFATEIQTNLG